MESNDKHEETKKAAEQLTNEIKEKAKQLEEIQNDCRHPGDSIRIKDTGGGTGRSEFRKVCDLCGKVVGYPTQDELNKEVGG